MGREISTSVRQIWHASRSALRGGGGSSSLFYSEEQPNGKIKGNFHVWQLRINLHGKEKKNRGTDFLNKIMRKKMSSPGGRIKIVSGQKIDLVSLDS